MKSALRVYIRDTPYCEWYSFVRVQLRGVMWIAFYGDGSFDVVRGGDPSEFPDWERL